MPKWWRRFLLTACMTRFIIRCLQNELNTDRNKTQVSFARQFQPTKVDWSYCVCVSWLTNIKARLTDPSSLRLHGWRWTGWLVLDETTCTYIDLFILLLYSHRRTRRGGLIMCLCSVVVGRVGELWVMECYIVCGQCQHFEKLDLVQNTLTRKGSYMVNNQFANFIPPPNCTPGASTFSSIVHTEL